MFNIDSVSTIVSNFGHNNIIFVDLIFFNFLSLSYPNISTTNLLSKFHLLLFFNIINNKKNHSFHKTKIKFIKKLKVVIKKIIWGNTGYWKAGLLKLIYKNIKL